MQSIAILFANIGSDFDFCCERVFFFGLSGCTQAAPLVFLCVVLRTLGFHLRVSSSLGSPKGVSDAGIGIGIIGQYLLPFIHSSSIDG